MIVSTETLNAWNAMLCVMFCFDRNKTSRIRFTELLSALLKRDVAVTSIYCNTESFQATILPSFSFLCLKHVQKPVSCRRMRSTHRGSIHCTIVSLIFCMSLYVSHTCRYTDGLTHTTTHTHTHAFLSQRGSSFEGECVRCV